MCQKDISRTWEGFLCKNLACFENRRKQRQEQMTVLNERDEVSV